MDNSKSKISKQVDFWQKFGFYSPLVFVGAGMVLYWTNHFDFHSIMIAGGTFAAAVVIIWWWWALYTIHKLDKILKENTENFKEMVSIVKDIHHNIYEENNSNRQRGKSKPTQVRRVR